MDMVQNILIGTITSTYTSVRTSAYYYYYYYSNYPLAFLLLVLYLLPMERPIRYLLCYIAPYYVTLVNRAA